MISSDSDGYRHHRLEQLDRDLLLVLVDLLDPAFSPLNGPAMSSTMSPSTMPDTMGFGVRKCSISAKVVSPFTMPRRPPDALDEVPEAVRVHRLDEDIAPDRRRRQDREHSDRLRLRPAGYGVGDCLLVAYRCLDREHRLPRGRLQGRDIVHARVVLEAGVDEHSDLVAVPRARR